MSVVRDHLGDHKVYFHLTGRRLVSASEPCAILRDPSVSPNVDEPLATLHFRDRESLYLTLLRPEVNWGDLYSEGRVEVEALAKVSG